MGRSRTTSTTCGGAKTASRGPRSPRMRDGMCLPVPLLCCGWRRGPGIRCESECRCARIAEG
eukprot:2636904-Rhodomonas_salina.2